MADEPLDRFAGGVQYPLASPSKRCLQNEFQLAVGSKSGSTENNSRVCIDSGIHIGNKPDVVSGRRTDASTTR
jgi:hypothetical protein